MAQVFATYRVQTLHRPCVLSYGVAAGALVPAHRAAGTDLPGSVPRLMHRGSGTLVYEDRAAYSDTSSNSARCSSQRLLSSFGSRSRLLFEGLMLPNSRSVSAASWGVR